MTSKRLIRDFENILHGIFSHNGEEMYVSGVAHPNLFFGRTNFHVIF